MTGEQWDAEDARLSAVIARANKSARMSVTLADKLALLRDEKSAIDARQNHRLNHYNLVPCDHGAHIRATIESLTGAIK